MPDPVRPKAERSFHRGHMFRKDLKLDDAESLASAQRKPRDVKSLAGMNDVVASAREQQALNSTTGDASLRKSRGARGVETKVVK